MPGSQRTDVNANGGADPRYRAGKDHSSAAVISETEAASREYPSVEIPGAEECRLHVYQERDGGGWCVWLNTEVSDFDGLCIASGKATRDAAVADAVRILEAAVEKLHGPGW